MITKRKKNVRQRGSKTHGYGAMKKHRGAGHRGGRGNAGSGKRGDAKKPTMLKMKRRFGKHGFSSKSRNIQLTINLRTIEEKVNTYLKTGKAKEDKGFIYINLADIGCDKLLANGRVTRKYSIECQAATPGAIAAVEKAGGKVTAKEAAGSEDSESSEEDTSDEQSSDED